MAGRTQFSVCSDKLPIFGFFMAQTSPAPTPLFFVTLGRRTVDTTQNTHIFAFGSLGVGYLKLYFCTIVLLKNYLFFPDAFRKHRDHLFYDSLCNRSYHLVSNII